MAKVAMGTGSLSVLYESKGRVAFESFNYVGLLLLALSFQTDLLGLGGPLVKDADLPAVISVDKLLHHGLIFNSIHAKHNIAWPYPKIAQPPLPLFGRVSTYDRAGISGGKSGEAG